MSLEKIYIKNNNQNKRHNYFIDVGHQLIKIGHLNDDDKFEIVKIETNSVSEQALINIFSNIQIDTVYIGSVVKSLNDFLANYFTNAGIKFVFIRNEWFLDYLKINPAIDIREIGSDILAFCFLIREAKNAIAINFGTATVLFSYINSSLNGVMIGSDYTTSWYYLYNILNLSENDLYHYMTNINLSFGTNTIDALLAYQINNLNGFVNYVLDLNPIVEEIFVSGGASAVFTNFYKNDKQKSIFYIKEATIQGYYALIKEKFKKIY